MSESEKRLREWVGNITVTDGQERTWFTLLDALLAEHRAEVAAARDAALEEVAQMMETWPHLSDSLSADYEDANTRVARRIRALRSQPALAPVPGFAMPPPSVQQAIAAQSISVAKVREVLLEEEADSVSPMTPGCTFRIMARLGVPLDAEPEVITENVRVTDEGRVVFDVTRQAQGDVPSLLSASTSNAPRPTAPEKPADARRECTCKGSCRGPDGLGEGWRCALGKEKTPAASESGRCEGAPDCGWHNGGPCKACKKERP